MRDGIRSYPSIYNLGHKAVAELLTDPVVVQEKVDGSQFSFCRSVNGLMARSKNAVIDIDVPPGLFQAAVNVVKELPLAKDYVYRGEFLSKPQHNVLAYDRIPIRHIVLFDIDRGMEDYMAPNAVRVEGKRLGLETVPTFFEGKLESYDQLKELMETVSFLGGNKIEGVVIKNYYRFGPDKKPLIGKFVSEAYKEVHDADWQSRNPTGKDLVAQCVAQLKTEARWHKAVQHLRDAGVLTDSPKDIGPLLKELNADVLKEEEDSIKEILFKHFWKDISRGLIRGFPEWYKEGLAQTQFEPREK